jgi:hypothetical protein
MKYSLLSIPKALIGGGCGRVPTRAGSAFDPFALSSLSHCYCCFSPAIYPPSSSRHLAIIKSASIDHNNSVAHRILVHCHFSRHCEVIVWPKSDIPAHPVSVFPSLDNLTYRELVDNAATLSIAKRLDHPRPPEAQTILPAAAHSHPRALLWRRCSLSWPMSR